MTKRYEVWIDGELIGRRESVSRDYSHAIVGRVPKRVHDRENGGYTIDGYHDLSVLAFAGNLKLANARAAQSMDGETKDVAVVPVTVVEKWSKAK